MVVDGTHGFGRAFDVSSLYDRRGCDVIGQQETRRSSGHSAFPQACYLVYRSGECCGESGEKKGQSGVGLAVKIYTRRAACQPEFINDCLLRNTLELPGRTKSVTFIVAYAPTEAHNASNTHYSFLTSLDRAVEEVCNTNSYSY